MTWINVLYFALGALAVCTVAMHRLHAYRMRVAAAMAELREWQTIQNVRNDTETRTTESTARERIRDMTEAQAVALASLNTVQQQRLIRINGPSGLWQTELTEDPVSQWSMEHLDVENDQQRSTRIERVTLTRYLRPRDATWHDVSGPVTPSHPQQMMGQWPTTPPAIREMAEESRREEFRQRVMETARNWGLSAIPDRRDEPNERTEP